MMETNATDPTNERPTLSRPNLEGLLTEIPYDTKALALTLVEMTPNLPAEARGRLVTITMTAEEAVIASSTVAEYLRQVERDIQVYKDSGGADVVFVNGVLTSLAGAYDRRADMLAYLTEVMGSQIEEQLDAYLPANETPTNPNATS